MAELPKRRVGRFYVSTRLVYEEDFVKVLNFIGFIPLRVECLYNNQFEYIGLSKLFEALPISDKPPKYDVIISMKDDKLVVKAKKC